MASLSNPKWLVTYYILVFFQSSFTMVSEDGLLQILPWPPLAEVNSLAPTTEKYGAGTEGLVRFKLRMFFSKFFS